MGLGLYPQKKYCLFPKILYPLFIFISLRLIPQIFYHVISLSAHSGQNLINVISNSHMLSSTQNNEFLHQNAGFSKSGMTARHKIYIYRFCAVCFSLSSSFSCKYLILGAHMFFPIPDESVSTFYCVRPSLRSGGDGSGEGLPVSLPFHPCRLFQPLYVFHIHTGHSIPSGKKRAPPPRVSGTA